jgi:hypothetical protein
MIILIDNDKFVRLSWSLKAKKQKMDFQGFSSVDEFLSYASIFPRSSTIYIDSNLDFGQKGEIEAKKLNALGFTEIHLCTGYEDIDILATPWIKSIVGKSCPF